MIDDDIKYLLDNLKDQRKYASGILDNKERTVAEFVKLLGFMKYECHTDTAVVKDIRKVLDCCRRLFNGWEFDNDISRR